MKPPKGTKGRKPKPHSKGGRREALANRQQANRRNQPRAEAKRAEREKSAGRTGGQKIPARRRGRLGRIDTEPPGQVLFHAELPGPAPDANSPHRPSSLSRFPPRAQKPLPATAPLLAIVGRPNVGKSSLFNRLTGSRRSIVGDEPGMTRDRIYGEVEWLGKRIRVVDTGGILPESRDRIPAEILRQARSALDEAAFIIMVVDGRTPLASPDYELARLLFQIGKPILLAVNKLDTEQMNARLEEYRRLGIRDILPISCEHGMGIGDLLDHVFSALETAHAETASGRVTGKGTADDHEGADHHRTHGEHQQSEISIAIIGRPNVGKSTLLNALTGSSRAIVSPVAGTTRDAVDEVIEYDGARLRFVDTAGIRRKGKTTEMAEKLSVVMARRHLEAADLALVMIDATAGVTSGDATIGGYAHQSGRSVILVVNKWDLVTTGRTDGKPPADQEIFERQLRGVLKYLSYAPVVFVSASEGKNVDRLLHLVREVAAERHKRVSTGQMNRFLEQVDLERATVPMAHRMRIFYMTQAAVAPPTFILFTNRQAKLHFSFERFLENQIRAAFGFRGSPIWFKVRARQQRKAK